MDGRKSASMDRTRAVLRKYGQVFWSPIAFVLCKSILGKLAIEFNHHAVTGHLRNDAGSRDGITLGVAIHNGGLWKTERHDSQSVNKRMLRRRLQLSQGFIHSAVCCLENIDCVNRRRVRPSDPEANFATGRKKPKVAFALFRCQLFGIIETA